jgi:HEAT repeat protein
MDTALASLSESGPLIWIALATGLVSLGLTVLFALQVALMRALKRRRDRLHQRCLETWRPVLYQAAMGESPMVPALARVEETSFLILWNQLQDGLRGRTSRLGLNLVAGAVDAHAAARRSLRRSGAQHRLLALRTLRYLGEPEDFELVRPLLDERGPTLCLAAARALLHVDRAAATPEVWRRLLRRTDWPLAHVAAILRDSDLGEADMGGLAVAFATQLPGLGTADLKRLLPLLSLFEEQAAASVVRRLLSPVQVPEVLSAALKQARGEGLLPDVVRLCGHPAWPVRTQAAVALGRLGGPAQRDLLLTMTGDPQWWVRYRSAQALLSGRFGDPAAISALGVELQDRYARDILSHVLAETRP